MKMLMMLLVIPMLAFGTLAYWISLYILFSVYWYQIFSAIIPMIPSFVIASIFYLQAKENNRKATTIIKAYCNRILTFLDCINRKEKDVYLTPSKLGEVPAICKTLSTKKEKNG